MLNIRDRVNHHLMCLSHLAYRWLSDDVSGVPEGFSYEAFQTEERIRRAKAERIRNVLQRLEPQGERSARAISDGVNRVDVIGSAEFVAKLRRAFQEKGLEYEFANFGTSRDYWNRNKSNQA